MLVMHALYQVSLIIQEGDVRNKYNDPIANMKQSAILLCKVRFRPLSSLIGSSIMKISSTMLNAAPVIVRVFMLRHLPGIVWSQIA